MHNSYKSKMYLHITRLYIEVKHLPCFTSMYNRVICKYILLLYKLYISNIYFNKCSDHILCSKLLFQHVWPVMMMILLLGKKYKCTYRGIFSNSCQIKLNWIVFTSFRFTERHGTLFGSKSIEKMRI